MALGSDKFRDWHVTPSWPLRHEKSAGQGLRLLAPKETQGKRSFSPLGTAVSDCNTWTYYSHLATSLKMGEQRDGKKLETL